MSGNLSEYNKAYWLKNKEKIMQKRKERKGVLKPKPTVNSYPDSNCYADNNCYANTKKEYNFVDADFTVIFF
jgi:hypothetical protein